ncbi:MAG TPA: hypothetical protein VGS27_12095 [Candidatus Sulfotelmatobacter sp.]|nr:hypothetical protein [Candidatus Sulfotelmatobacter sp.]
MARTKRIFLWSVAFLSALALLVVWQYVAFGRGLRSISVEPFVTIVKKAASDVVVAKQSPSSSQSTLPAGYLLAYEQNREGFNADAKLFDAWLTASQLGTFVLERGPNGNWVRNSSAIEHLEPKFRLDPWGHSLCVLRRGDSVLVISGGPYAPSSPVCMNVRMTDEDLAAFPHKKLLQTPAGSLVLVVGKGAPVFTQPAK